MAVVLDPRYAGLLPVFDLYAGVVQIVVATALVTSATAWPTLVTAGVSTIAFVGATAISVVTIREGRRSSRIEARRAMALEIVGWLHAADSAVDLWAPLATGPTADRGLFVDRMLSEGRSLHANGRALAARWAFVQGSSIAAIAAVAEAIDATGRFTDVGRPVATFIGANDLVEARQQWASARDRAFDELVMACDLKSSKLTQGRT